MQQITHLLALFTLFISVTYAQGFKWAKQLGSVGNDIGYSITVDDSGNVFSTGFFGDTLDFDPDTAIYNQSTRGVYVQKLDVNGNFAWVKHIGDSANAISTSVIAVDDFGNVFIAGAFKGSVDFDPGTGIYNLSSKNNGTADDIFIQKLDVNGNFIWAKQLQVNPTNKKAHIALDNSSNVYVTGDFSDTVDFDPGISTYYFTSFGGIDIYVQKLDANGNFVWAKQIGGSNYADAGYAIALDDLDNIHITGIFSGTVDFDPGPGTTNFIADGNSDIFILKLDKDGNFIWAKQMEGGDGDIAYSIVIDEFQNGYSTGYFWKTVDFDPGTASYNLTSSGKDDIFIQKLDSNGDFIWVKQMGGSNYDLGYSIAIDTAENVYTTGWFDG